MSAPQALASVGEGPGWISRWVRILSAYLTAQSLTQLLGIAAGLLFVNFMPVRELALYTLAFSVITFFTFVSDLGSTTSLVYFFRHAQGAREEVGRYVAAVMSLVATFFGLVHSLVSALIPALHSAKGPPRFSVRSDFAARPGFSDPDGICSRSG